MLIFFQSPSYCSVCASQRACHLCRFAFGVGHHRFNIFEFFSFGFLLIQFLLLRDSQITFQFGKVTESAFDPFPRMFPDCAGTYCLLPLQLFQAARLIGAPSIPSSPLRGKRETEG